MNSRNVETGRSGCVARNMGARPSSGFDVFLPLSLTGEPGVGGLHQVPGFGARLEPHRRDIGAGQNEMALDVAHGERWSCATFLALKR
jgi:hypothetical protein